MVPNSSYAYHFSVMFFLYFKHSSLHCDIHPSSLLSPLGWGCWRAHTAEVGNTCHTFFKCVIFRTWMCWISLVCFDMFFTFIILISSLSVVCNIIYHSQKCFNMQLLIENKSLYLILRLFNINVIVYIKPLKNKPLTDIWFFCVCVISHREWLQDVIRVAEP